MLIYSNSCKLIGWMNDSMINEDTLKSPRKIPTTNTQADNQSGMHKKKANGVTQTVKICKKKCWNTVQIQGP